MTEQGDVNQFRTLCQDSSFRHRDEILVGLERSEFRLTSRTAARVPAQSMLGIFEVRLKIAEERAPKTEHAISIQRDMTEYIAGLKGVEDRIRIWHLTFDNDVSHFSVFEAVNSGKIVGCIYGVDRRKVTMDEWDQMWGGHSLDELGDRT